MSCGATISGTIPLFKLPYREVAWLNSWENFGIRLDFEAFNEHGNRQNQKWASFVTNLQVIKLYRS